MSIAAQKRPGQVMKLSSVNDMLGVVEPEKESLEIALEELQTFKDYPLSVKLDQDMAELLEDISENGLKEAIIVRPAQENSYEIISGHRRVYVYRLLHRSTIACKIREMDDDTAIAEIYSSNLKRSSILPSEKARLYKMRLDAMKRKAGRPEKNYSQVGNNFEVATSGEELAKIVGESRNQIYRYIRLLNLQEQLLDLVDENKIKLTIGVELSYLGEIEQVWLCEFAEKSLFPNLEQAKKIRAFYGKHTLTKKIIEKLLQEDQEARKKVSLKLSEIKAYFPPDYSSAQIQEQIMRLLENWNNKRA